MEEQINKIIEGVGKDAEIVTNANGGKQSKSPTALHLIDPQFLYNQALYMFPDSPAKEAILHIATFMQDKNQWLTYIRWAMDKIEPDPYQRLIKIGKTLQEGAERYEPNNWRLIPREEHINHALIHLIASIMGDTQDEHLNHALCRLMMSYATELTEGFSFTEYIKKVA